MMKLENKKIIALVEHEFEDLELMYPVLRLREEGAEVNLVGAKSQKEYVGKYGVPVVSDYSFDEIDVSNYDGVIIPGGWAPDKLRRYPEVLDIIQKMNTQKKAIGHICHAGWVLASAQILSGKKITTTPAIKDDMENAGAAWVDQSVVVDGHIVSSRRPADLPDYARALIEVLAKTS